MSFSSFTQFHLTEHGRSCDSTAVKYFNEIERESSRVLMDKGLFQTSTQGMRTAFDENRAIYVMDETGTLFICSQFIDIPEPIYHSSLLAGKPVIAAGLIEIKDGKITYIDNCSGHYKPTKESWCDVLSKMQEKGMIDESTVVGAVFDEEKPWDEKAGFRILTERFQGEATLTKIKSGPRKRLMFIANFDGIVSHECGAGEFVKNMVLSIEAHNEANPFDQIIPILITPNYTPGTGRYNPTLSESNDAICKKFGGEIWPMDLPGATPPVTSSTLWEGRVSLWGALNTQIANAITERLKRDESSMDIRSAVLVVNDTPNASLMIALPKALDRCSESGDPIRMAISATWIPHSTAQMISGLNAYGMPIDVARDSYEQAVVRTIKASDGKLSITPIGAHMRAHLTRDYSAADHSFRTFQSGIIRAPFLEPIDKTQIDEELERHGIPTDKPLVFSMGRGLHTKGHDLAVEAFSKVAREDTEAHLVILAPEYPEQDPEHTGRLNDLLKEKGLSDRVTLITSFERRLPKVMYQHENTLCVVLPTRVCPEDLIPMECRAGTKNAVLVVSDRGSNLTNIHHEEDGLIAQIGKEGAETTEHLADQMRSALTMKPDERAGMVARGRELVERRFDAARNFTANFLPISVREKLVKAMYERSFISFGKFPLTHESFAPVYVDCRQLQSHPDLFRLALDLYQKSFAHFEHDKLCGVPMGTVPTVGAASTHLDEKGVFVRKARKTHGLGRLIEGAFLPGERLLIVEDVVSTGGSALEACTTVINEGARLSGVVCLIDAGLGGKQNLQALGIEVKAVFDFSDFLTLLEKYVTDEEREFIAEARADMGEPLTIKPEIVDAYSRPTRPAETPPGSSPTHHHRSTTPIWEEESKPTDTRSLVTAGAGCSNQSQLPGT